MVVGNGALWWAIYYFLLVARSSTVITFYRIPDISTFTAYVIAYDLEKCFSIDTTFTIITTYAFRFLRNFRGDGGPDPHFWKGGRTPTL